MIAHGIAALLFTAIGVLMWLMHREMRSLDRSLKQLRDHVYLLDRLAAETDDAIMDTQDKLNARLDQDIAQLKQMLGRS